MSQAASKLLSRRAVVTAALWGTSAAAVGVGGVSTALGVEPDPFAAAVRSWRRANAEKDVAWDHYCEARGDCRGAVESEIKAEQRYRAWRELYDETQDREHEMMRALWDSPIGAEVL